VKQIRKRLTYANVMSTIAVFLVVGGASALAATQLAKNSVGSKQLKSNAVTSAKIKKEAVAAAKIKNGAVSSSKLGAGAVTGEKLANDSVTTDKLANSSVTAGKLADGSVGTGKLADGAVNSGKLAQNERSEAFQVAETSGTVGPLPNLASTPTTLATLQLPAGGNYVVTGETALINTDLVGSEDHYTECALNDDGVEIASQVSGLYSPGLFPSGGLTLAGVANGGTVVLACHSDNNSKTFSFERRIIAIRVGSVG
jgi:hypothetical protein